jgi:putative membrane protein|tara:strand:- start:366 stop:1259 length:894 start_codon:yes stop_codon:yes gene_type:complete
MKKNIILILKGMGMGIANVIPGVSGGTVALITGIYQELLKSLKSFDKQAFSLLLTLNFKEFGIYTNLSFLAYVFGGSLISLFSIASLFKFLFKNYPLEIWSLFFGLILASIIFIGQRIKTWNFQSYLAIIIGTLVALSLTFITPSAENNNLFYVFLCGIIGISGMILPGLSGSYILILMGNYELLMVRSVSEFDIPLLLTFLFGSIFGLLVLSNFLHWLINKYYSVTLAGLTGFIIGSLSIIWPWKVVSESIIINGKEKVLSYDLFFPNQLDAHNIVSIIMMIIGFFIVYLIEKNNK